jgi:hypothetical protein
VYARSETDNPGVANRSAIRACAASTFSVATSTNAAASSCIPAACAGFTCVTHVCIAAVAAWRNESASNRRLRQDSAPILAPRSKPAWDAASEAVIGRVEIPRESIGTGAIVTAKRPVLTFVTLAAALAVTPGVTPAVGSEDGVETAVCPRRGLEVPPRRHHETPPRTAAIPCVERKYDIIIRKEGQKQG